MNHAESVVSSMEIVGCASISYSSPAVVWSEILNITMRLSSRLCVMRTYTVMVILQLASEIATIQDTPGTEESEKLAEIFVR
jgi:hypothetical protein